jgi:TatD DNase family protein
VPKNTVLHCFTGGPAEAERCLEAGMTISFSGIITFPKAPELREAAALVPLDRLLIETDSPFLAPVPHRGKPNEPSLVALVGAAVAAAHGVDPSDVATASSNNARRIFAF